MKQQAHKLNSWHVSIAAEATAAALFARCGVDVSVQYGANQPEYDLMIARGDKILKVSVKGSQDGAWGLCQSFLENANYHEAIKKWLNRHNPHTILCFVQFEDVAIIDAARVYLATPSEVAQHLNKAKNGKGDTTLHEMHTWGEMSFAANTTDEIPKNWKFSFERINQLLE